MDAVPSAAITEKRETCMQNQTQSILRAIANSMDAMYAIANYDGDDVGHPAWDSYNEAMSAICGEAECDHDFIVVGEDVEERARAWVRELLADLKLLHPQDTSALARISTEELAAELERRSA